MISLKKQIIKPIYAILLCLLAANINAQPINSISNYALPNYNITSINRYLESPVNGANGIPAIAIPFESIGFENSILDDISISYHAGGVKVGDLASDVGLNWSLNAGGSVNRVVYGGRDEQLTYGYMNGNESNGWSTYLNSPNIKSYDTYPDLFNFQFGQYSGKLMYNLDTNNGDGGWYIYPAQGLKVEMAKSSGQITSFTFTDPYGNKYIFGNENVDNTVHSTSGTFTSSDAEVRSSWHLSEVVSYDEKYKLVYSYEEQNYSYPNLGTSFTSTFTFSSDNCSTSSDQQNLNQSNPVYNFVKGKRLSQIQSKSENSVIQSVNFIYDTEDRKDLDPFKFNEGNTSKAPKRLEKIQFNNGNFCKQFSFTYFYSNESATFAYQKRLYLQTVQENICNASSNSQPIPPYEFTYSETELLPARLSKRIDHWGFFNDASINDNKNFLIPYTEVVSLPFEGNTYTAIYDGSADRTSNANVMTYGSLKDIIYPTEGRTEFELEANAINGATQNKVNYEARFSNCNSSFNKFVEASFTELELQEAKFNMILDISGQLSGCSPRPNRIKVRVKAIRDDIVDAAVPTFYSSMYQQTEADYILIPKAAQGKLSLYDNFNPKLEPNVDYSFQVQFDTYQNGNEIGEGDVKFKITKSIEGDVAVGGLRLAKKKVFKKNRLFENIETKFNYDILATGQTQARSSGVIAVPPVYGFLYLAWNNNVLYQLRDFTSSAIFSPFDINGSIVNYGRIRTTYEDGGYVDKYYKAEEFEQTVFYPAVPAYTPFDSGQLLQEKYHKSNGSILKSITYNYETEYFSEPNTDFIAFRTAFCDGSTVVAASNYKYPPSGASLLKEMITEQDGVSETTKYDYKILGNGFFMTNEILEFSDIKEFKKEFYYQDTYDLSNSVKEKMIEDHLLLPPWQVANSINNIQIDGSIINIQTDGNRTEYNTFSNKILPEKEYRYEYTDSDTQASWELQRTYGYTQGIAKPNSIIENGWNDSIKLTWNKNGKLDNFTFKEQERSYIYYPSSTYLGSFTDIDGQKTTYQYDGLGRLQWINERRIDDSDLGKRRTNITYTYRPNKMEVEMIYADTDDQKTTQTIDGLGRLISTIDNETNAETKQTYDNVGRLQKEIDPLKGETIFTYYPDPLNRIETITDPMGFVSTKTYGSNGTDEVEGYAANTLYKETTNDPDGNKSSIFTDKLGRVVASRTFTSDEESITYTNYDDKSRVSTIIPPGAAIDDAGLIYQYTYDGADNVEKVKFPDKGLMVYKYDDRNLQTSMQDANLKAKGKWLNSIYDDYGRLHQQGFSTSNNGLVTDLLIHNYYDKNDNINIVNTAEKIYRGKLHKSKVNILNGFNKSNNYLITTYALDSYGRVNAESNSSNHIGFAESTEYNYDMADNILKDKHTVGNTTATETFDFDPKGRLISNDFELTGKGKKTVASYAGYSLKDEVIIKKIGSNDYNNDDILDFLQTVNYGYNHNGWLSSINGGSLSGTKNNCSTISTTTSNDLFALDIRYNNAALSGSTNRKNGNISEIYWQVNERKKNAYRFQYDYLNRLTEAKHYEGTTQAGHYDTAYSYDERGNIMSLKRNGLTGNWNSCAATKIDNLSYMYAAGTNKLSRVFDNECDEGGLRVNPITNARYDAGYIISDAKTNIEGGTNNSSNVQFKAGNYITLEGGFSYDLNGNNGGFNAILDDCTTNSNLTNYGFKGAESSYRYDGNGNLIFDSQKQLNIAYNHLNLPYQAKKDNNNKIEWKYTADGRKLQKKVTENGTAKIKNYLGNMEYTQSGTSHTLEAAYHSEGRVLNNGDWEYNLKDHLGNVRIVFKENGSSGNAFIMQENHYYPFGMQLNGRWKDNQTVKNDYLYNGKELNAEIGLDWSDYGFRQYDAAIGRFTGVDPISDQFAWVSTYNYAENSPIANIDLWGLQAVYSAAAAAHSGEGAKFAKQHPKAATAIAIGFFAAPVGFSIAAEAGSAATVAFVSNEIKDEVASKLTNGGSDFLDLSKNLKNLGKYGIKKLDIGGGANSKYSDALNVDPNAETGFKGTLGDFVEQTGGDVKFADIVVDNPQVSFLKDAENLLEEGGTITVRGTMSNKYFNKVVNKKAEGIENFNVSSPKEIPNKGFNRTDGNSITGQMYEIKINH